MEEEVFLQGGGWLLLIYCTWRSVTCAKPALMRRCQNECTAVPAKHSSSEKGSRIYPIFTVTELAAFHCRNRADNSLKIVDLI